MRRATFLTLTGLSIPAHRAMVRADVLPYAEDPAGGWADYSVKQAFMTSLTIALAGSVGGQKEAARRVVDFPHSSWRSKRGLLLADQHDVWAASFAPTPTQREWRVGVLSDLLDGLDVAELGLRDIAIVNISAIARDIKWRAEAAGLQFDEEFSEAALG